MEAIQLHGAIRVANCVDTIRQPKRGDCNMDGAYKVLNLYMHIYLYILYLLQVSKRVGYAILATST